MDRFIVQKLPRNRRYNKYLKSNMDRFIDFAYFEFPQPAEFKIQYRQIYRADYNVIIGSEVNLKSNMDRFIVTPVQWFPSCPIFKIQYGQIYRNRRIYFT